VLRHGIALAAELGLKFKMIVSGSWRMLGVSLSNSIKSPRNIINLGTLEEES
jgi:hypothetical protein